MTQHHDTIGALKRLHTDTDASEPRLAGLEREIMTRIGTPRSRLRAVIHRAPALVLVACLTGGVALGAGAVAVLDHFGISVVRSGDQEYLRFADPDGSTRFILPVEDGEGLELQHALETGQSRLLELDAGDLDANGAAPTQPVPPTDAKPRVFRMESAQEGSGEREMMFETGTGRKVRGVPRLVIPKDGEK